jgi:hypothetical protein
VKRTFNFASESLILNIVYNLMSPVLNGFLKDFAKDGNKIIIETYYPKPSGVSALGVAAAASDAYKATYHFASILEVRLLFS